jgi:diamine N-acetyltransferase
MIDKNYQNQGIGVVALEKFIELFTSMYGAKKLYTSAEVTNPIAIALYEQFGFKKTNISEYEHKGKTYVEQGMVLEL